MRTPLIDADGEWFKQLFDASPDPAWVIDGNRFVECNDVAVKTLGYASRKALLNVHPSQLSPPTQPDGEDSFAKAERMMALSTDKGLHRFEWIHTKADGSDFPAEVTLSAIEVQGRTIIYCVWRDMTERNRADAALRKREAWFQALSTMSSDWFWQQDDHFRFMEFSGAFASDFTPPSGAIGKTRWDMNIKLSPEQWAVHRAVLDAHLPFKDFEYPISDDKGEVRWYSINGEPQFDADGRFTGYLGTGRNITQQKRIEEKLHIAAIAFETQEGMLITDARTVILQVNWALTQITGYAAEELIGSTPQLLKSGRHDADFYDQMWGDIGRNGVWRGEVWGRRKSGENYPAQLTITAVKSDDGAVTHYVGTHADISARKLAEEEIEQLAFTDSLTGLPNRRLLMDRLHQALAASGRNQRRGALILIDLDHFKTLNDTLGHDMGDLLLREVAQRLEVCLREGDTVARLGGDEFVVMLVDLHESAQEATAQIEVVAAKIHAALSERYQLTGSPYRSTPSLGVTVFSGHEASVEELLKQADLALYKAKTAGRNTVRFFDPEMQTAVNARAALENELREGLRSQQFVLYYQPQVDGDGRLTGAEALLRWQHPQRGLVGPLEFIALAEETGLILRLGKWVLEAACDQLALWAQRAQTAHLSLAVNVSANQLHQADFVDQVIATLERTGAMAQRLKLELTESVLVSDVENTIAKMSALKSHGVGFSLDDFGTGYSSLSILKRLPLEQLKIDRSFVSDILVDANDAAIARTVIALAESMGLKVIAEGVETEGQRRLLAEQGCHAYQGYLFSRPVPLDEFDKFVLRG